MAYDAFLKARQADQREAGWLAIEQMAQLSTAVQRDLLRVGCGVVTLMDAPAIGGRQHPEALVTVAVHNELADRYNVRPQMIVLQLQAALGEYDRLVRSGFLNLWNPLWWLRLAVTSILRVPFDILGFAGFDQEKAEASPLGRAYKLISGTVVAVGTVIALLNNLKGLGVLQPLQEFLSHLVVPTT